MDSKIWKITLFLVLMIIGVSACSTPKETEVPDSGLPPVAAVRAREALGTQLGIGLEKITFVAHEQKTWSDSCLGLGGIAESCLRTDVPGWLVELSAEGVSYFAHTDELGEQIRFEN